jgi:hypothetical protein
MASAPRTPATSAHTEMSDYQRLQQIRSCYSPVYQAGTSGRLEFQAGPEICFR